jgi:hypothetical protein
MGKYLPSEYPWNPASIPDIFNKFNCCPKLPGGTRWRILFKALCYKPGNVAGSIPDSAIVSFHWHKLFRPHYGSGVDSAFNTDECQGYLLGGKGRRMLGLTTLPSLCADCLETLGVSTSGSPKGLSRPVIRLLYLLPKRQTVPGAHTASCSVSLSPGCVAHHLTPRNVQVTERVEIYLNS